MAPYTYEIWQYLLNGTSVGLLEYNFFPLVRWTEACTLLAYFFLTWLMYENSREEGLKLSRDPNSSLYLDCGPWQIIVAVVLHYFYIGAAHPLWGIFDQKLKVGSRRQPFFTTPNGREYL